MNTFIIVMRSILLLLKWYPHLSLRSGQISCTDAGVPLDIVLSLGLLVACAETRVTSAFTFHE